MKKILWPVPVVVAMIALVFVSCFKKKEVEPCVTRTLEQDMLLMTKFATDNSITTMKDPSGILFQIIEAGNATHPSSSSSIVVKYTGKNMSGTTFDSGTFDKAYPLSDLIKGWQIALPKIGVGGKMKAIMPSVLCYGCNAPSHAVLNQPLYFEIELVSIQ